jgi:release factor family 3
MDDVIDHHLVETMARVQAFPAVSIFLNTDRHRPGNVEDPRRLRVLVDEARQRLADSWDKDDSAKLVDRIERVGGDIDWGHPDDALALYVTSDEEHIFRLPMPVRERVVIEETFATRELLLAAQIAARFRVLVVSEDAARMFEGAGRRLHEVHGAGFPMASLVPKPGSAPHRDLPVHETAAAAHRFVFRAVDRNLGERNAADPLPLAVVAPERDLAYFDEVTAHSDSIVARIAGDHTHAHPAEIAALVVPHVQAAFEARHATAVGTIEQAATEHRVALTIPQIWAAAMEGRGRVLVVEDDFTYPAHVVGGVLVPRGGSDSAHAVEDAVDEIIEAVLLHGGDAVIVGPGRLGQYEPIALALRY